MSLGMTDREVIERLRAAQEAASGLGSNTAYIQTMDLRWVLAKLAPEAPPEVVPEAPAGDGVRQWVTPTLLRVKTNGTHTLYVERQHSGHYMYLITRGNREVGCGMAMIEPAECERLGRAALDALVP